ncbi:MAG TPA: hypothetical protein VGF08_00705 [Terriglobales bacterium]|jgi:hypothetical protein
MSLNHAKFVDSRPKLNAQLGVSQLSGDADDHVVAVEAALGELQEVVYDLNELLSGYGLLWHTLTHDERVEAVLRVLSKA